MEKPMNIPKIPQTDSIQELAQFWDTHDLTDFEDELEEVKESVFECKTVLKVQLEPIPQAEQAVNDSASGTSGSVLEI
jgi:hypothetical protein